jgi:hypothetical protein
MVSRFRSPQRFRTVVIIATLTLGGCTRGLIYTNVTRPLTLNMNHTPRGVSSGSASTHQVRDPVTQLRLSAEWNSRAIGDAMLSGMIADAYYADLTTISVLGGIWSERTVTVYGTARAPE